MEHSEIGLKEKTSSHYKSFGFRVSEQLFGRIGKIINLLKYFEKNKITRRKWLEDAFKEKLAIEESQSDDEIPPERNLNFVIDEELLNRIELRVNILKRFRTSYSKKKWVLEAVDAKLEKDERLLRKLLDEARNLAPLSDHPHTHSK